MSKYTELTDRFSKVVDILVELERQVAEIDETIAKLKEQGITTATIHWRRKDDPNGKPDMLELVHRLGSNYERKNGRRREYIGTNPGEIKAALARCKGFRKVKDLEGARQRAMRQLNNIQWAIKNVFRAAGEKQGLWGQDQLLQQSQVSPGADGDSDEHRGTRSVPGSPHLNGDNEDWGQRFKAGHATVSPSARANPGLSPRGFVPKDMAEVKAYFEHSPELANIAKDLPG